MEQFEKVPTTREELAASARELKRLRDDDGYFFYQLALRSGEQHETLASVESNLDNHKIACG
jgi:hypothetical protein